MLKPSMQADAHRLATALARPHQNARPDQLFGMARFGLTGPGRLGLCRYITRPALANERVQINAAGQVVLQLKTAWRDGTTHIVPSPLEFMQRLA